MKKSKNHSLGKTKFFNFYRGKQENNFFFILPTIIVSPKRILNWDMVLSSIFLSWGRSYIQFNICEVVKDTSTEVHKEHIANLMAILKTGNLSITDLPPVLEYINKNPHIINILKNANLNHPYVRTVLIGYFNNLPFVRNN